MKNQTLNLNNPPQLINLKSFAPNTSGVVQITQISGMPYPTSNIPQSNCMSGFIEPSAFPFSLDDPSEVETYRLWKKLCTITELRDFEENHGGGKTSTEDKVTDSTHTVDQYINYLINISQENVPSKVVVKTGSGRPIFQHQKQKFTQKRKDWIQQNQELVEQLDNFANAKKEAERRELELKLKKEREEELQRLAELFEEGERQRENALLPLNGEEVITDSAPTIEGTLMS